MKKISWDEATNRVVEFIRECDADTLAGVYQNCFGGNVTVNDATEELEIEPEDPFCGERKE